MMEQALRYPPVVHTMEGHKQIHNGGEWLLSEMGLTTVLL